MTEDRKAAYHNEYEYLLAKTFKKHNGCWVWLGARSSRGYGNCSIMKRQWRVHRYIAYCNHPEISFEDFQEMIVAHTCDTPLCINPDHLVVGTQKDNIQDARAKNRLNTSKGEDHYTTNLTVKDIVTIREKYAQGRRTQHSLGLEYGIAQSAIHGIIHRRTWKDVP